MDKPYWLSEYEVDSVDLVHGFDDTGLWFVGDAGDEVVSYPVRTNFSIGAEEDCEVKFTFIYNSSCADQGICFFNEEADPYWSWGPHSSRLAVSFDCGTPVILGSEAIVASEDYELELGFTYTCVATYIGSEGTLTVQLYVGEDVDVEPITEFSITDEFLGGDYRIGFNADLDGATPEDEIKSYFTFIAVNNYETVEEENLIVCNNICEEEVGIPCKKTQNCTCSQWKIMKRAYVPAIIICNQQL